MARDDHDVHESSNGYGGNTVEIAIPPPPLCDGMGFVYVKARVGTETKVLGVKALAFNHVGATPDCKDPPHPTEDLFPIPGQVEGEELWWHGNIIQPGGEFYVKVRAEFENQNGATFPPVSECGLSVKVSCSRAGVLSEEPAGDH